MGTVNKRSSRDHIICVALDGFSGPSLAMLEYCIAGSVDCDLVEPAHADIVVINGDQPVSLEQLEKALAGKFPDKTRILISIRDLEWPNFYILKKPHSSEELLGLIRRAYSENESELRSSVKAEEQGRLIVNLDNLDFYQKKELIRKRQEDALRKKLKRGNVAISAADRLVQQLEVGATNNVQVAPVVIDSASPEEAKAVTSKANKTAKAEKKPKQPKKRKQKAHTEEFIFENFGNLPDIDLSKPEERRRVFINTEGMLIEKMLEAVKGAKSDSKPVEIVGLPGKMVVLPETGKFVFSFTNEFLNQLALTKFGFGELSLQQLEEFHADSDETLYDQEIESLIWELAIWTARGRLFHGIEPEKAIQLIQAPDFEQFLSIPRGEEIAELWSGRKISAVDVAGILDVPQRFVFAFMSGIFSLGWFEE